MYSTVIAESDLRVVAKLGTGIARLAEKALALSESESIDDRDLAT